LQYKWTVLTVTTIGVLMAGLDSRIVVIGLPEVISALHADAAQGIWINQAYLLGSISIFLLVGRLTDIFGRKNIYTGGFAIFTIGSLLTSIASDPLQVVFFRIIQGIGAGTILTNSVAIIVDATPRKELGFSLSVNNLGFRFGAMAGLTVSGIILSFVGDWRALFYINVPIGIFGTVWAQMAIKENFTKDQNKKNSIDWSGVALFTIFVTTLLLGLTYAAYGIGSELITLECFAISLLSLVAFVIHERRCDCPLLDFSLFRIREYTGGVFALLINAISWGAVLLLLSFYFQLILGLSPLEAGIRLIPFDIAFLVAGPLSGKLSDRFGHMPFTTAGIIMSSISLFLLSTVQINTPFEYIAAYMVLFGAAIGSFSSPNMSSVMSCVPPDRRGIGSAVRATFFNVGFATSLNLAILVLSFTVPYALITQILTGYTTNLTAEKVLFMQGVQNAYLWLAGLNILAIVPSVLRGKGSSKKESEIKLVLDGEI
jgi:EmrB/QacA subfamily drug resistance transporter